jgi:hypothetical protein
MNTLYRLIPVLLVALSLTAPAQTRAEGSAANDNLLANPSFEQTKGDGVSGWKSEAVSSPGDVKYLVETPGRTGKRCVSIRSEKGAQAAWTTEATVTQNNYYLVSGWIKTRNVKGSEGARLVITGGGYTRTKDLFGSNDWTHVVAVFRAGGKSKTLKISCQLGDRQTATGQAWFDDLAIELADGNPADPKTAAKMIAACPPIAFVRRANYGMAGMQSVMFGQRTGKGSAICVYDPARPADGAKKIFETAEGFIYNMNPSYDGKRLVFSYKKTTSDPFHVWEIATDGSGLRQLTRGPYHDFSPVYYPDGRIIFSSSRVESYSLCQNYLACALYAIKSDGSDIRRIDWTTLCTTTPAVLSDGSILCTRWEYQDKNIFGWGGLWTINPNGRQLKLYHGNTFRVPNIVCGAREIPGTKTAIVVWTGHHRPPMGDLAIVDRRKGLETLESMWKTTHVTPVRKELAAGKNWRLSGVGGSGADAGYGNAFADPFPFSTEYSVVSYAGLSKRRHALWVLDHATGQTALVYETKKRTGARFNDACFSPVPLSARKKPAAIPGDCPQQAGTGTFLVQDVYQGLLEQGVKRGSVKRLRVMSQSPKKYNTEGFRYYDHYPLIGQGSYYVKLNHGTAPVDADGSAYFKAPSNRELYFIALDEHGREIQRMGSVAQITTGETTACVGCHENRLKPPKLAAERMRRMKRPPDALTAPPWGSGPVNYVTQVQPIFDKYCIKCHAGAKAKKGIDLTGDKTRFFSLSYETLTFGGLVRYYYINKGPNGVFPALSTGSWVSKLTKLLESNHGEQKVKVDDASRRCIYAWIDANIPYYGSWDMSRPHTIGGRDAYARTLRGKGPVFSIQKDGRLLTEYMPWIKRYNEFAAQSGGRIGKINTGGSNRFGQRGVINLTNPEASPVLLDLLSKSDRGRADANKTYFTNHKDPKYIKLLTILKEASAALTALPRMDMTGGKAIPQERNFGRIF